MDTPLQLDDESRDQQKNLTIRLVIVQSRDPNFPQPNRAH